MKLLVKRSKTKQITPAQNNYAKKLAELMAILNATDLGIFKTMISLPSIPKDKIINETINSIGNIITPFKNRFR